MGSVIKLFNRAFPISLHDAIVIHANKYSRKHLYGFYGLLITTLYTDIIFRSKETGKDWPIYVRNLDLHIYNNQEVFIISVDKKIVGYVDKQTNLFYYTTTNFAKKLGIGINLFWIAAAGLPGGLVIYFLMLPTLSNIFYYFLPLIICLVYYFARNAVINFKVKKSINNYMESEK